jgi:transcriptional regulator with XRE-family HTH domain
MRIKTASFGSYIKKLREKERLPLRKVAAELDIDPSTLGKFEKNTRRPSKKIVMGLSKIYKVDYKPLLVYSLSDKFFDELQNEEVKYDVLKITEKKLRNHQK